MGMGYEAAMAQAVQQRLERKQWTIPIGAIVEARAWEILKPGTLEPTRGDPAHPYAGVQGIAKAGWRVWPPINALNGGVIDLQAPPGVIFTPWTIEDIAPIIGNANQQAILEIAGLYNDRVIGRGILTPEEEDGVEKLLTVAVIPQMVRDPSKSEAWNKTADLMAPVIDAWIDGQLDQVVARRRVSAAKVAAWEAIYVVAKTVADAPKVIGDAVGDGASKALGGFAKAAPFVTLILGILGIGWLMSAFGGSSGRSESA